MKLGRPHHPLPALAALLLWASGPGLAGCGAPRPIERTAGLAGPILRREGGSPKVVRERAAEVRRLSLDFAGVRQLRMEQFDGDVHVRAIERGTPELRAHLRTVAGDHRLAVSTLESIEILTRHEDDTLVVRLERPDLTKPYLTSSSYDLLVPPGIRVRVVNDAGDVHLEGAFSSASIVTTFGRIEIFGTRGDVSASSESGDVVVERVECDKLGAESTFGDVAVRQVRAREVQASSRSGNVRLESVRADISRASSSHGLVDAVALEGDARLSTLDSKLAYDAEDPHESLSLRTGRGEIACEGGRGSVTIESESGRVAVTDFEGSVVVDSHYGNVDLSGVFERVRAESGSGKLGVTARQGSVAAASWHLRANFGNVVLALPASFACRLEAVSGRGTIRTEFPVELDEDSSDGLAGLLNGGGGRVRLESQSGRIEIHRSGG